MEDVTTVGVFDDHGFPTGYHALLEGEETTICGIALGDRVYPVVGETFTCPACVEGLGETLVIHEPVEIL